MPLKKSSYRKKNKQQVVLQSSHIISHEVIKERIENSALKSDLKAAGFSIDAGAELVWSVLKSAEVDANYKEQRLYRQRRLMGVIETVRQSISGLEWFSRDKFGVETGLPVVVRKPAHKKERIFFEKRLQALRDLQDYLKNEAQHGGTAASRWQEIKRHHYHTNVLRGFVCTMQGWLSWEEAHRGIKIRNKTRLMADMIGLMTKNTSGSITEDYIRKILRRPGAYSPQVVVFARNSVAGEFRLVPFAKMVKKSG